MKKLLFLFIIPALVATSAFAQDYKDHKDMKKDRAEWQKKIKDELKLTSDQTTKYDALCKEYDEKTDAVLADATLSKEAQKEKLMSLKKEKEDKLFEFLTPEQQTSYKTIIDKKKKDMMQQKQEKPGS